MNYLGIDGKTMVKAILRKSCSYKGHLAMLLCDEQGNLLNTEPVGIIYENYHPWAFELFKKALDED